MFIPHYGPPSIRAFGQIALPFLEDTPIELPNRLLSRRGMIEVVLKDYSEDVQVPIGSVWLDEGQCQEFVPILKSDTFSGGIFDPSVASIDVNALRGLYVRMFQNGGGVIHRNCEVVQISRTSGVWTLHAGKMKVAARHIINAAGAWGDSVAKLAGVEPVGLVPKRRTAVLIDQGQLDGFVFDDCPWSQPRLNIFISMMISPEDETPCEPCDIHPEELDISICIDRFKKVTTTQFTRIEQSWAGLRTFVPNRSPVIGWDCDHE